MNTPMLVYRIVHKKYSGDLVPSGLEGRWNSKGRNVIYASESIPMAFLESMVRRQGVGFNSDFRIMIIYIPEKTEISTLNISDLKGNWRDPGSYSACQAIGDRWYDEAKTMVLKVPSAVLPESSNFVINAEYPDFHLIKLVAITDLVPDERIENILKKYP
jgi:RES domain-containing protein